MPKVKTTNRRLRSLGNAVAHLLNQPKMDPLFSLRLATIQLRIESRVKALKTLLDKLEQEAIEKDGENKKVPVKDARGKRVPNSYQLDPDKVDQYKEDVEKVLETVVGFKASEIKLTSLIEAWEQSVNTGDDDDDPEKQVQIPGWVTMAFYAANLLVLDAKDGDLAFLDVMDEDDDDEELPEDAVADKPRTPKQKKAEDKAEKTRKATG